MGECVFTGPVRLGARAEAPDSIAIAEMNRDGRRDVVVGNNRAPGSVFFNESAMKFRGIKWGDGEGAVYGLATGDLDGDGWPDIAAAGSEAANGIWFSVRAH